MPFTTWDNQRFCEVSDVMVKTGGSLSGITLSSDAAISNGVMVQAISTAKDKLRREFIIKLQHAFPNNPQQLLNLSNKNIQQAWSNLGALKHNAGGGGLRDTGNSWGSWNYDLGWTPFFFMNQLQGWYGTENPWVFWCSGAPDSTTYAGTARQGDFLGSDNGFIYTNYSTDSAAVTWTKFQPADLINYVSNPTELRDANVYAAIEASLVSSSLRQGVSSASRVAALELLDSIKPLAKKTIADSFDNVIPALAGLSSVPPWAANRLSTNKFISVGQ